jgi:hypothetical protein
MRRVVSISGGQTSAYLAANYNFDNYVFSLVRTDDKECIYPDKKIRKLVEDRIQAPFVGTLEDNNIIYTLLDLEQFIGKKIDWVSGVSFDELCKNEGGLLPSALRRFCTTELKIRPIFHWWYEKFKAQPIEMAIGYRANEFRRAKKMISTLNNNGLSEFKATFEKHKDGRNKWVTIGWRKPIFPLIDDNLYKYDIIHYWSNKSVRFAKLNNCVGCFHRSPALLNKMWKEHPAKMQWFSDQEENRNKGTWRSNIKYKAIKDMNFTLSMFENTNDGCTSGFCGM